ncbi:MAG: hypothetical protein OXE59_11045 [Bacteroidetes bacterium]|nr:hypothetical protein [Bacteroidota bacterium]
MQYENFKRIVNTFADEDGGVIIENGQLIMSIRGRDIEAEIRERADGIMVIHDESEWTAEKWIRIYLARLDFLADRIIKYVKPPIYYVSPHGELLDWQNNSSNDFKFSDATCEILSRLDNRAAGTTTVYYLTSDAGEGKTSLIEKISVEQAYKFKKKQASSLILPIPLGGRSFLRFDDAVIALLSNSLRFQFLYYDSFLELVKMGAIIPAFDGYEEMLSETQSGDAISAIGHLLEQLSSTGTILVSVRRGYYESSLRSDSKIVDSIRFETQIETHHYSLNRWNRNVFLEYAHKRNISDPNKLYERVKSRLGREDHPVLTRAILVRRLIDVALEEKESELDGLLNRIERSQTSFFFDFIEGIVEREVNHKMIDQSGAEISPLLTLDEHHELLSQLSFEMWVNSVTSLDFDTVQLIIKLFVEDNQKRPDLSKKICDRIHDHALLRQDSISENRRAGHIRFDHEDFQEFYLGQSLARAISRGESSQASAIMDVRSLTPLVIKESARYLVDPVTSTSSIDQLLRDLNDLLNGKWHISYIHENCAALMIELSEHSKRSHLMQNLSFPINILYQRKLQNLKITGSFFNNTSIADSELINCTFQKCRFAELSIDGAKELHGIVFDQCTFDSVVIVDRSEGPRKIFDPNKISAILQNRGFQLNFNSKVQSHPEELEFIEIDEDLKLTLKFMRMYHRATAIHDYEISKRIGKKSNYFFRKILPELENARLIDSLEKSNKKFRLLISLSDIDRLVDHSGSTFQQFIQEASSRENIQSIIPIE